LTKVIDVIGGLVVGGIVWIVLNIILGLIPIIGWILAAIVGGYLAGRIGGSVAVVILALLAPIIIGAFGASIISILPLGFFRSIIGGSFGIIITAWALINLLFVGLGGYIGNKAYRATYCTYCGKRILEGTSVCSFCGRELSINTNRYEDEDISQDYDRDFHQPQKTPTLEILDEKPQFQEDKGADKKESLMSQKLEKLDMLENLTKKLIEGEISEDTYKEIRIELKNQIKSLDKQLKEFNKKTKTKRKRKR
jgi:hypothetical protein